MILIVRNSATGTSNTFTGVDLIAPGGFGSVSFFHVMRIFLSFSRFSTSVMFGRHIYKNLMVFSNSISLICEE